MKNIEKSKKLKKEIDVKKKRNKTLRKWEKSKKGFTLQENGTQH